VLSISTSDYPAIMGSTLVFALTFIIIVLITDLLYFIIDPRIKIPGGG
jgi:oligopeptide transport system permease protein